MMPHRRGANAQGYFAAGLVLTGLMFILAEPVAAQDIQSDYCKPDAPRVLLVIDVTTQYDQRDRELLVNAVQQILGALAGGERFKVRTVTESFSTSDRLFEGCVPVCDRTWSCSHGRVAVDRRNFMLRATDAMRTRLEHVDPVAQSDIIRTFASIVREDGRGTGGRTVYLFSDLIENSDHLSGSLLFGRSNETLMKHLRRNDLIPALEGAVVKVFGVGRAGTPGRPALALDRLRKLRSFWTLYFQAADAQSVEISEGLVLEN